MAHFYGTLISSGKRATKCGHKATGMMKKAGFTDTYRALHNDSGYTLHKALDEVGVQAGVRIDYLFANPLLADMLTDSRVIDSDEAYAASDHLPLTARFVSPA